MRAVRTMLGMEGFALVAALIAGHFCSIFAQRDFRIIDGREASTDEFPYQIVIESYNSEWCGGSILSENIAITAAHCVYDVHELSPIKKNMMHIRVGAERALEGGKVHIIEKVKIHEKYKHNSKIDNYDVALLLVQEPFELKANVQPIDLADYEPEDGAMAYVTGYGTQAMLRGSGNHLMAVEIPIRNIEECKDMLSAHDIIVTDLMICAGHTIGHKDACAGDSGGPLVVDGYLAGLVAFGYGCGHEGLPGVYTSVPKLVPWINNNINILLNIE